MATKRMISKKVIESSKFMYLSKDAQLMYMLICANVDDEGVCNCFFVTRVYGIDDAVYRELVDSGLIIEIPGDNMVAYVTDHKTHNNIRSERVNPSFYHEQLMEILAQKNDENPGKKDTGKAIVTKCQHKGVNTVLDSDTDIDSDTDSVSVSDQSDSDAVAPAAPNVKMYGTYRNIPLADNQYYMLVAKLGFETNTQINMLSERIHKDGSTYTDYYKAVMDVGYAKPFF